MKKNIVWVMFGGVIILFLLNFSMIFFVPNENTRGTFGDQFGAVNALFSGLAFAGLIYTIVLQRRDLELQRHDLKLQRDELALTRQEMEEQTAEFEKQNETLRIQRFENTFFNMLSQFQEVVNTLSAKYKSRGEVIVVDGREIFKAAYEEMPVFIENPEGNGEFRRFKGILNTIKNEGLEGYVKADHGGDLTDEELEENVTSLEDIEKADSDLGDFGYIIWRVKGLQKGDSGIFGTRRDQSPYMIIVNDMVVLLVAEVSKFRKNFSYASWQISCDDLNMYDCDGEVVNEISLEEFARLKRFVIDETEKYGWGPAQEKVKLNLREEDRTAGVLHSVGYNEEREQLRVARMEDEASPRPIFLRNSYRFSAAELKEYACKQEGKEYDVLKDRSLFLFQFDIDNYRNDLKRYVREGEDISGLPYVDKLFDKKYWEGKDGYQKKLEYLEETYHDLKEKGYTFEDFMNNLRSRRGGDDAR